MRANQDVQPTLLNRILKKIKKFTMLLLVLFFLLGSSFAGLVFYLQSKPLPSFNIEQNTFIYSMDGEIIDELYTGEKRIYVPLSKIPKSLVQATVAIEDRKFYNHFGIDVVRIGGALFEDIKQLSKVEGASTITQQLAKNLFLTREKTWKRKIKEALLSLQLELHYSKDQILEMYLNEIYYGHSTYGVQMASRLFFGKDVSELNLAESSMIAGVPKGPLYFSPFIDLENAKNRQKQVLQSMVNQDYITQTQADEAYNTPLVFMDVEEVDNTDFAPYLRDYVIYQLKNEYGIEEDKLYNKGLKIYTTIDAKIQKSAEDTIKKQIKDGDEMEAALISIEPKTGFIKAMVGGKNYEKSQFNRVFAKRQPGSSFKPLLYLAALENGFTSLKNLKSEPTVFTFGNNKTYQPSNYADRYAYKDIDMRYALTHSDNIYAVKTHLEIGMDKLVDMAKRLGIDSELQPYPSLALGSQEVSPYEMAEAYATIANQGKKIEPTAIIRIEDHEGNVIYQRDTIKEEKVVSDSSTFILTYLMEGVFEPGGTGFYVSDRLKRPVAGKTGTTDYDSWLIGFTPQLATALWTGYDKGKELEDGDSLVTKEIWADYMEEAHSDTSPQLFVVPDEITSIYIDPESGKIATTKCPNPRLEVFKEGTEPTEVCDIHKQNIDHSDDQLVIDKNPSSKSLFNRFLYWWND